MLTIEIYYIVAPWFLFILAFGHKKYIPHAAILFIATTVNVIAVSVYGAVDHLTYIQAKEVLVVYDGITALFLLMVIVLDGIAWKQASLLAFAVLCHTMIIYDLTENSSAFSVFFYNYYDELIITVGVLQMMVSHNGFTTALSGLQNLLHKRSGNNYRHSERSHSLKKRKAKT